MSNKKLRIVDMCIYIDENIYKESFDTNLIYKYLYLIVYSLAKKNNFFKNKYDYINYSYYCAQCAYMRLTSKKQFLDESDPRYLKPIDSVLNYIKKILYPAKVNYQKSNFNEYINLNDNPAIDTNLLRDHALRETRQLNQSFDSTIVLDMESYLDTLDKTILNILNTTPYSSNKTIIHNLYISCLINFLNMITLNNKTKKILKLNKRPLNDSKISKLYMLENNPEKYVCWNLDDAFKPYLVVLMNRIRNVFIHDIQDLVRDYDIDLQYMQDLMILSAKEN